MSIDVSYYSFSPSRSDKKWSHAIEDILVLRKKHSSWRKHERDIQVRQEKIKEIEDCFEPRLCEARKKIFDFFDKQGYIIPWVEWNKNEGVDRFGNPITVKDEDRMEYLLLYGCVYPREAAPNTKDVPYLMLRMDAPELEEAYNKIIDERKEALERFSEQNSISPSTNESVTLNKRQEELDNNAIDYLIYDNKFDKNRLLYDLIGLDLYYGSVENEYFESPKLEYAFLEALVDVCDLKTEGNVPTKSEWIRLFENIDNEIIQKATENFMQGSDWNKEYTEWAIKDYLRSVRPAIKDLKDTPDSVFVRYYGGEIEVEPKSAQALLLERAERHIIKYKQMVPPVL